LTGYAACETAWEFDCAITTNSVSDTLLWTLAVLDAIFFGELPT
jgi:hypothetical protein